MSVNAPVRLTEHDTSKMPWTLGVDGLGVRVQGMGFRVQGLRYGDPKHETPTIKYRYMRNIPTRVLIHHFIPTKFLGFPFEAQSPKP